jgi:hypothetical protein
MFPYCIAIGSPARARFVRGEPLTANAMDRPAAISNLKESWNVKKKGLNFYTTKHKHHCLHFCHHHGCCPPRGWLPPAHPPLSRQRHQLQLLLVRCPTSPLLCPTATVEPHPLSAVRVCASHDAAHVHACLLPLPHSRHPPPLLPVAVPSPSAEEDEARRHWRLCHAGQRTRDAIADAWDVSLRSALPRPPAQCEPPQHTCCMLSVPACPHTVSATEGHTQLGSA